MRRNAGSCILPDERVAWQESWQLSGESPATFEIATQLRACWWDRRAARQRHLHVRKQGLARQPTSVAGPWPDSCCGADSRSWWETVQAGCWNVRLHLIAQQLVLLSSKLLQLLLKVMFPVLLVHGLTWNAQLQKVPEPHRGSGLAGLPGAFLSRSGRDLLRRCQIPEPTPILSGAKVDEVIVFLWVLSLESCGTHGDPFAFSKVDVCPRIRPLSRGCRCAVATMRRTRLSRA
mmetsp:Transcript_41817/g.77701  ORF Transcript_41817/g.77701 Transcript_41817/m.77701 type:complete len:233 (-) Transcript_41817:300-998(-)